MSANKKRAAPSDSPPRARKHNKVKLPPQVTAVRNYFCANNSPRKNWDRYAKLQNKLVDLACSSDFPDDVDLPSEASLAEVMCGYLAAKKTSRPPREDKQEDKPPAAMLLPALLYINAHAVEVLEEVLDEGDDDVEENESNEACIDWLTDGAHLSNTTDVLELKTVAEAAAFVENNWLDISEVTWA